MTVALRSRRKNLKELTIISSVLLVLFISTSGAPVRSQTEGRGPANRTDVPHADLISDWNEEAFKRGKDVYQTSCPMCHGEDGTGNMPAARSFTKGTFENGADPYSLFRTITNGYKQMPGQSWLTPSERYGVIHYIREKFLKEKNPGEYVDVTEAYLSKLPEPAGEESANQVKKDTDYAELFQGALVSQLGASFPVILSVSVGEDVTVSYNLHRMRTVATWQGGFLDLSKTKFENLRGEGNPLPEGTPLDGLQSWYWAYGTEMDHEALDLDPRSPAPEKWMSFEGRFTHGNQTTLHYTINGRKILETPGAKQTSDFLSLNHTLRIGPGEKPLKLVAGEVDQPADGSSGVMALDDDRPEQNRGPASSHLAVASTDELVPSGPFFGGSGKDDHSGYVAAAVAGQTSGLSWSVDENGRIILSIPAEQRSRVVRVMRFAHEVPAQLDRFKRYVNHTIRNETVSDPEKLTKPGPNPFTETIQVEGKTGGNDRGYAVDTIPVPIRDNPYGAWVRPSALAFYEDGRAAVATYTGDVWIVSGIDESLDDVRWRRFATGFHEPLGARVFNGTLHLTCRDGIKRVHDYNQDGYADHIEQLYADHDVSSNWHAFHFGLVRDKRDNYYFAKSGRYTDFRLPGGIIKVSPNGERHEVTAIGFRVPNGIGQFPHEGGQFLTASDNQGHYVPASKINVIKKGGFYGYSGTKRQWHPYGGSVDTREGEFPPDSFDPPMVWIPHKLDNSSGGQLWVDDDRFGPLSDHLIHSSFGSAKLYYVLPQKVGDTWQGGIVALPHEYDSGVMRLRVNPVDGQVYTVGLNGWNNPPNASEGCFQRLRHTGNKYRMIDSMAVTPDGLKLTFNFRVGSGAKQPTNYTVRQWNYKWSENYGSDRYHPDTGEKGRETVKVNAVQTGEDDTSILLELEELQEVQQMHVKLDVPTSEGASYTEDLYLTVNRVPDN